MTLPGLVRANNLNDVVDRERAWDNLGSSLATGDIAIPAPSLDLNFAANKSLVDDISGNNLITFTRDSIGTFVGSNGLIQTAASGVPRFDHNPTTGESLGLLVEEARTNRVTYSEDFANVAWIKSNATVTASQDIAPNGALTGSLLYPTATSTSAAIYQGWVLNGYATMSVYAKSAGKNFLVLWRPDFVSGNAWFNLATGEVASVSAGTASIVFVGNGWYRCTYVSTVQVVNNSMIISVADANGSVAVTASGTSGIYIWGAQAESSPSLGSFPTSYIPTTTATVTRAADVASITGANFSSWYNANTGTLLACQRSLAGQDAYQTATFGLSSNNSAAQLIAIEATNDYNRFYVYGNGATAVNNIYVPVTPGTLTKDALAYANNDVAAVRNGGTVATDSSVGIPIPSIDRASLGHDAGFGLQKQKTIARLTYWPSRLNNIALKYITQLSITAINVYAFNYAINGKDVLALNAVRNASTRNFIFIKGLLSAAQPRLTTAAASTSSALTLATNALPKLSPTSSGNYFFASGITLSGVTTRINGTNALSIATSPFSGSTATAPLLFRELRPQANWRFTEPMPSGTIASPEFAIPFETNDFVLFMKAGPN